MPRVVDLDEPPENFRPEPISRWQERRMTYKCFRRFWPEWPESMYVKMLQLSRRVPELRKGWGGGGHKSGGRPKKCLN